MNQSEPNRQKALKQLGASLLLALCTIVISSMMVLVNSQIFLFVLNFLNIPTDNLSWIAIIFLLAIVIGSILFGMLLSFYLWIVVCAYIFSRATIEPIVVVYGGTGLAKRLFDQWFPEKSEGNSSARQQYNWQASASKPRSWQAYPTVSQREKPQFKTLEAHLRNRKQTAVTLFIVGFGILWFASSIWREQARVANWPIASGYVVQGYIEQIDGGRRDRYDYIPYIVYQYDVNKMQFENNVYLARPRFVETETEAEEIVQLHPTGSTVNVTYNPQNPQESFVVSPSITGADLLWFAYGIVSLGAALWQVNEYYSDQWYYTKRPDEWDDDVVI